MRLEAAQKAAVATKSFHEVAPAPKPLKSGRPSKWAAAEADRAAEQVERKDPEPRRDDRADRDPAPRDRSPRDRQFRDRSRDRDRPPRDRSPRDRRDGERSDRRSLELSHRELSALAR